MFDRSRSIHLLPLSEFFILQKCPLNHKISQGNQTRNPISAGTENISLKIKPPDLIERQIFIRLSRFMRFLKNSPNLKSLFNKSVLRFHALSLFLKKGIDQRFFR